MLGLLGAASAWSPVAVKEPCPSLCWPKADPQVGLMMAVSMPGSLLTFALPFFSRVTTSPSITNICSGL